MNLIKLRIPFANKNYIKKNNKPIIHGNCFFIFDLENQCIIDEYIQIINASYRATDKAMIKPTSYYTNKKVKYFRDKYLDNFNNINPKTLTNIKWIELSNNQIKILNNFFRQQKTTIKSMYSYLTGSNISGAELNHNNSPLRCIDNEYFDCNFANVLDKFVIKKYITKDYIDNDIPIVCLNEFIKNNFIKKFKEIFNKYNQDFIYQDEIELLNIKEENITYENINNTILKYEKNNYEFKQKQILYIESICNKTIDNFNQLNNNNIKNRLRAFYNTNVKEMINKKYIPLYSTIKKCNLKAIDNAHIIPFNEYKNNWTIEQFKQSIDPFNCLRINKDRHSLIDKKENFLDDKGNLLNKNKEIIEYGFLDMKNMPLITRWYFNKYLEKNKI